MNLMRDILAGAWMMEESYAHALLPLANQFLSGKSVDFSSLVVSERPYGLKQSDTSTQNNDSKGVVVVPIKGMILKYNYCGEMGMMQFEKLLQELKNDDEVGAIVLDMDTGGGEASYMTHVAQALREFRAEKPILTYFSGCCASAGYYIASNTTEIYASTKNDCVGSIGTMITLRRPNPENKTSEYIIESIYATKSTAKNLEFEQALKGNSKPITENLLDPFNEEFHAHVMEGRPPLNQDCFDGRTLLASQAIEMGMIDGIMRLNQVIERAFTLIQ